MNSVFSISNPAFDYATQNPGILTNGLVCYYSFENPNCYIGDNIITVRDLSTSGNTGRWLGSNIMYNYNSNSGSIYCTPTYGGSMQCTNNGLRDFSTTGMTIGFWANYDGASSTLGVVMDNGDNATRTLQIGIFNNYSGHTALEWYNNAQGEKFSDNVATVNGWHYWALSVKNEINWYQDRKLINTTTGLADLPALNGGAFYIGTDWPYGDYFRGFINDIQIYNRILTADEIAYNYNATKWRFL